MIVWGGYAGGPIPKEGGIYDLAADRWRPMSTGDAPYSNDAPTPAVWTGENMIVYGGSSSETRAGGVYCPAKDAWKPISSRGAPHATRYQLAVWTGTCMILWGGEVANVDTNAGWIYEPGKAPGYYYLYVKPE